MLRLARQRKIPICNACARWALFQISFRPQQKIEAKLGGGRTIHSGPSFARHDSYIQEHDYVYHFAALIMLLLYTCTCTIIILFFLYTYILLPNSPAEPLPSSIDSQAWGIVPQQSTSSLHPRSPLLNLYTSYHLSLACQQLLLSSKERISLAQPTLAGLPARVGYARLGEDVTDSQQEKQHKKCILSETTTSSVGKLKRLRIHPELELLAQVPYSVYIACWQSYYIVHVLVLTMHSERSACSVPGPFLQ